VVGLAGGVGERGLDVIRLKVGKVAEDFLVRHTLGQHPENIRHADAKPPDTGSPAAFARLDGDAFQKFHGRRIVHRSVRNKPANGNDPKAFEVVAGVGARAGIPKCRDWGGLANDDYTYAMDAVKIGQPVKVIVLRDGKRVELTATPEARK